MHLAWRAAQHATRVWLLLLAAGCWLLLAAGSWLCTANYRQLPAVIGIPGNFLVITKPIFSYQEIARLYLAPSYRS